MRRQKVDCSRTCALEKTNFSISLQLYTGNNKSLVSILCAHRSQMSEDVGDLRRPTNNQHRPKMKFIGLISGGKDSFSTYTTVFHKVMSW